ncbi:MAG: SUMF1/EgtB/PvdO family nonheme iron enzyme [Planctomycetota bacterium]|nr:SUMF1/EgtB/PvdO family nonheme iron enzyme [Planctomycetota bacterium]
MRKIAFLILTLALAPVACAPPADPKAKEEKKDSGEEKTKDGEKAKDEDGKKATLSPEELAKKKKAQAELDKKLSDPDLIIANRELWAQAPAEAQDKAIAKVAKTLGAAYGLVSAKEYECGKRKHRIATFRHEKSGLLLQLIPGGVYQMGDEGYTKKRRVKAMLIGAFEVRQSCWDKIGGENKRDKKGADWPVNNVSWDDAVAWLKKAGDGLRLPSVVEWEYACRAGTTSEHFWGDEAGADYCWHDKNSGGSYHAVTEHSAKTNAFGLADCSGNLFEWCDDMLSATSTLRAYSGGKFEGDLYDCRSAKRGGNVPDTRSPSVGFRVARSID